MVKGRWAILLGLSLPLVLMATVYYSESFGIPTPQAFYNKHRETSQRAASVGTRFLQTIVDKKSNIVDFSAADMKNRTQLDYVYSNQSIAKDILSHDDLLDQRKTRDENRNDGGVQFDIHIYSRNSSRGNAELSVEERNAATLEQNRTFNIVIKNDELVVDDIKAKDGRAQGDEEDVIEMPMPSRDLSGYVLILDTKQQLNLHCSQCAYVSSSGQLLGTGAGSMIDALPCVFRMNDAPVTGYERDVGSKTTVRMVAHSAIKPLHSKRNSILKGDGRPKYLVVWGPAGNMRTNGKGFAYNIAKGLARDMTKEGLQVYMMSQKQMTIADDVFETETGNNRVKSGSWLSTGWFTMMLARAVCDEIHVFGMVTDDHCRNHPDSKVPYHYYQPTSTKECSMYRSNEGAKKSAHRFMTEKAVFARWSKHQPRIFFHHPDWMAVK